MHIGITESGRQHAALTGDPESRELLSEIHLSVVGLVGERKRVLDIGCGPGTLARALANRQCDIVGIDRDPLAVEEARRICTHAFVADVDQMSLSEVGGERPFDTIVLSDVLGYLREPLRVLDECRALLADDGALVAAVRNIAHGSRRLALLGGAYEAYEAGLLETSQTALFTAKGVEELFVGAGFKIERMERATAPIECGDFSDDIVAEVKSDPESETTAFILRATPLSNEAKYRAITKRFLVANSELGAAKQVLARRERELERLRSKIATDDTDARVDIRPDATKRQDQLVDGLRRSLDVAVAQYDLISTRETELRRQLGETIATRDAIAAKHEKMLGVLKIAADDRDKAQAQIAEERQRLADVRAQLKAALSERDVVESKLGKARDEAAALEGEVLTAWAQLEVAQRSLATTLSDRNALESDLTNERRASEVLKSKISIVSERQEGVERQRDEALAGLSRAKAQVVERNERAEQLGRELALALLERDGERERGETERARHAEIEQKLFASLAEAERLRAVCAEQTDTEKHLTAQMDQLAASMELESRRLASLIDAAQAGLAWKIKRFLGRFRGVG